MCLNVAMGRLSALCCGFCSKSQKPIDDTTVIDDQPEKPNAPQITDLDRIQEGRKLVDSPEIRRRHPSWSSSITTLSLSWSHLSKTATTRSSRRHFNDRNERLDSNGQLLSSEKMKRLRSQINASLELQDARTRSFLPESRLKELICESAVTTTLERHRSGLNTEISELATFVCSGATRIFAILVWGEGEQLIEQFYKNGFRDDLLPVRVKSRDDEDWTVESLATKATDSKVLNATFSSSSWKVSEVDNFCDTHQWLFLAPVFREDEFRYKFYDGCRMPFLNPSDQKETNFSLVKGWSIHPDHLQTRSNIGTPIDAKGHRVAVKELKRLPSMSHEQFITAAEAEADALKMIRDLDHPHLIKAIAYYTNGKRHYFIFPWARGGNLWDFWEKDPPKLDRWYLKWVFTQLCCLAGAIRELHHSRKKRVFRHGDLKPENILCFKDMAKSDAVEGDPCTLVIADVGLSRVHAKETADRKYATTTQSGTILYEPPERELFPKEPRSRRYDIWSLGCIYLEFIIWLLYGTAELHRFRNELDGKKFYDLQANQGSQTDAVGINKEVEKWIEWIKKDPHCPESTALRRLLMLVETRLLVVNVSKDSTPPSPTSKSGLHDAGADAGPDFPFVVRSPTNSTQLATTDESSAKKSRAWALEMHETMEKIIEDATSGASPRIEWMEKWDEPRLQGPRKFGNSLAPSHADAAKRSSDRNIVVR